MATVNYTYKDHQHGRSCTGTVTLKCGYPISETFVARDDSTAQKKVKEFIQERTADHLKTCKRIH